MGTYVEMGSLWVTYGSQVPNHGYMDLGNLFSLLPTGRVMGPTFLPWMMLT